MISPHQSQHEPSTALQLTKTLFYADNHLGSLSTYPE
jgi:hypothetical protein